MSIYKIVVVDDSALSRKILSESLELELSFEVVYAAPTAALAYKYLESNPADLILLDVNMPEIDGIEAAGYIHKNWPNTPILMCSALTERGADVTLRAMDAGASDYITKPAAKVGRDQFSRSLVQKVLSLVKAKGGRMTSNKKGATPRPAVKLARAVGFTKPISALAIGSSTGGPAALNTLFAAFRGPLPLPVFIVQHMPPVFTRLLGERLAVKSGFKVKEGEHGERVEGGVTYVAPGGKHMVVVERAGLQYIELNEDPQEHSCRPAVDVLFRSLAQVYRDRCLAAVLTGMGADGSGGTVALSKAGSEVLVQDPATCVVPSMPQASLAAGGVHGVMKLEEIAQRFEQRSALSLASARKVAL